MKIEQLHDMLTNGLNAARMNPTPFRGGLWRSGKHAGGHKGQTHRKRHGGTPRKQTQPHPSTIARRAAEQAQAAA